MSSPFTGLTRSSSRPIEHGEEYYLTLDLGAVDPSLLSHCASIRLVGLETPTPFLQLGDLVFQGVHAPTLGTELVLDGPEVIAQSEHKVLFNPVQLIPKTEAETETNDESRPKSHDPTGGSAPRPRKGRPGRPRGGGNKGRGRKRVEG